jgi:hypothetical protein
VERVAVRLARDITLLVADTVLAERERCAKIIEDNMLCDWPPGTETLHPRTNPGNKVGLAYAAAIRQDRNGE